MSLFAGDLREITQAIGIAMGWYVANVGRSLRDGLAAASRATYSPRIMTPAKPEASVSAVPLQEDGKSIGAYAGERAFRSAQADELVNEHDPLRRPVRPEDFEWLDFADPLTQERFLSLSGLLGQRLLLNAYETDYLFLPSAQSSAAWEGFERFYSARSVRLAEQARPALERHLFGFLERGERGEAKGAAGDLEGLCLVLAEERARADTDLASTLLSLDDPRGAARFILLQITCTWRAGRAARMRGMLGDHALCDLLAEEVAHSCGLESAIAQLLNAADLLAAPRAYWQFYLTSTLARLNHLYRLARDRHRFFEFVGALIHWRLSDRSLASSLLPVVASVLGISTIGALDGFAHTLEKPDLFVDGLLERLDRLAGPAGWGARVSVGLTAAEQLATLADADLGSQMRWADSLDSYRTEAERLQNEIDRGALLVDLDTFVETANETSTTHVHDEHRLVVIERGSMHFWHNVGHRIELAAGDKLLVPKARLHGSMVLSNQCTYHQPIIPDDQVMVAE